MIRKLSLVVALIAATCFAGLVFTGSAVINDTASAMTLGQNNNRNMGDRNMGDRNNRRRHRRHWRRHGRRHRRHGNMNR
jgi:hypothetical protein